MGRQTRTPARHRLQALERLKRWPRKRCEREEDALAAVVSECLDEMQRNGGDIEAALALHPELADEIRPLLEVAAMLLQERA